MKMEAIVIKDFWSFCVKAFLGRYDEMNWDDVFHLIILIGISTALLYVFV